MKSLIKLFAAVILFFGSAASSMAQAPIVPLKVGNTIPPLLLNNLLGSKGSVNLSELHRQDLLIINFWATWCGPCVRELPVLDSLVRVNGGKLRAIAVAYEPRDKVEAFFKNRPTMDISHLLITTDDKLLIKYFKHEVIPHNIWVDRRGVIRHITGGDEINQKNIEAFITQSGIAMHEKDDITNFDPWKPFHLRDSVFSYRSIETPFIDGIVNGVSTKGVWHHPTDTWLVRVFAYDDSREQLFWTAVSQSKSIYNHYGIMKIITNDSLRFYWPAQCPETFAKSIYKSKIDWQRENTFCYELTLPVAVKDSTFYSYMLNDLERLFSVKVYTEQRIMPVTVVRLAKKPEFQRPVNDSTYIEVDNDHLKAHNVPLIRLLNYLNETIKKDVNATPDDAPYLNETGISSRIDVDIKFAEKVYTYSQLKQYLQKNYGLNFLKERRDYPVTVIKDLAP